MEEAVRVIDLIQEFQMGKVVIPALKGVNLMVRKGEFVCIVGPSGSGKSTLLNLIGGLDRFVSGKILVNETDISTLDENQLALYRQKNIGFVFQSFNLIPTLTALQNVSLPLIFAGVPKNIRETKARKALESVGLADRVEHRPIELSGGEQQRVAIARALINQPSIVLADEPTGNIDTQTSTEIMNLLKEMNRTNNQTFLVITHDLEVSQYADHIVHIRDGLIVDEVQREKV